MALEWQGTVSMRHPGTGSKAGRSKRSQLHPTVPLGNKLYRKRRNCGQSYCDLYI